MKYIMYPLLISILLTFSCGKDNEPEKANNPNCSFSFKGISYSSNTAICDSDTGYLGINSYESSWGFFVDTDGEIRLNIGADYYQQSSNVSRSGNTLTFTGILVNVGNGSDTGNISGKCTCQ